jgi:uncharacterized protein (TIGR00288 family)
MKDIGEQKKIAVLIDADNAQDKKIKLILEELSVHGHIVIKRAYGDWSSENLKHWIKTLNGLAIQPIQQFAYTTGKNSTDAAMIIDAMDLLYSEKFDAFAIVSSDSDFTKLASRLRESEIFVFGFGEKKTPLSFRNACDDFIFTENLAETPIATAKASKKFTIKEEELKEIVLLLNNAWEKHQDEEGWANTSAAGSFIKRSKPDFDPRNYGVTKVTDIISELKIYYDMKKYEAKGTNIVAYKLKNKV